MEPTKRAHLGVGEIIKFINMLACFDEGELKRVLPMSVKLLCDRLAHVLDQSCGKVNRARTVAVQQHHGVREPTERGGGVGEKQEETLQQSQHPHHGLVCNPLLLKQEYEIQAPPSGVNRKEHVSSTLRSTKCSDDGVQHLASHCPGWWRRSSSVRVKD